MLTFDRCFSVVVPIYLIPFKKKSCSHSVPNFLKVKWNVLCMFETSLKVDDTPNGRSPRKD